MMNTTEIVVALTFVMLVGTRSTTGAKWESTPLKVFILAGQSNMEGQAEVSTTWSNKTCPHDHVQGPTNDTCYKNGTLMYQTMDPRTKAEFATTRDTNGWVVKDNIFVYYQEGIGKYSHSTNASDRAKSICPKGYCDNKTYPCSTAEPFGGCGVWGQLSTGFGVAGNIDRIGPEYGFGFALDADPSLQGEQVLFIKVAYGGTTLCGDWRPPSSTINNKTVPHGVIGPDYLKMVSYINTLLEPSNLQHFFPSLLPRPSNEFAGFGWFQGWNDGCAEPCSAEYEQNLVNLMADVRKEFKTPNMPFSIAVSGFDGWGQHIDRRLEVIQAQFNAANATLHPEAQPAVAEETRNFWRNMSTSPDPGQGYHFGHNAETYWLIGQAMGKGMVSLMNSTSNKV